MHYFSDHHDQSLEAALQFAVENGRLSPHAQDLLELRDSEEHHTAVSYFTAANARMESRLLSSANSVSVSTRSTQNSLIRERSHYLYTQLEKKLSRTKDGHQHKAMIQLSGFEDGHSGISAPSFDLFLSHCLSPTKWHETHCTMVEHKARSSFDNPEGEPICIAIVKYYDLKRVLHFSFNQARLWISPTNQGLKWDLAVPCVSLRELLDTGAFFDGDSVCTYTQADKYLLVLNLARCFFYLYDGPWGPCDWNADRVFFLSKPGPNIINGRLTPYICCPLPNENPDGNLKLRPGEVCPPRLLSFARLLLEIERGKVLPVPNAHSSKNKDLHEQLRHIAEYELRGKLTHLYHEAVKGCLYFDLFSSIAQGTTKSMRERHVIFQNIVENLRQQYDLYLWPDSRPENSGLRFPSATLETERETYVTTTLSRSELTSKAPSLRQNSRTVSGNFTQGIKTSLSPWSSVYASTFSLFDDIFDSSEKDCETRKVFLGDMKKFYFQYIFPYSSFSTGPSPLPQVREDRIRIAILDTGILGGDNLITAAKDRIRGYWSPEKLGQASEHDCKDSYGHGTHVARILLEVAPFADIFIAKVSENKDLEESKVHYIADAMKWAMADCKVHIITMSFGLDSKPQAVTDAMASAIDQDKIIFAAASNSGGNSGRAYPASWPGVICIHATDGYGNQAFFNPSKEGEDNFATLGVAIESRWENRTVIKSGTSFATPVAAGIAANVLQFAKNHKMSKYKLLCCYRGMREMFKWMSLQRGDYEYVSPWKVFRPQDSAQVEDNIKEICDKMRELLNTGKIPEP
ncbi:hypothetical protein N431DRAFT_120568 [Stipitochalara longipes BDJ]|nr:hypothetical protein N431DRAFT_120568 [Stipitochalara longipes BDJ]